MFKSMMLIFLLHFSAVLSAFSSDFESRIRDAERAGDQQNLSAICKEWYASGRYSTGLLNWNHNALMSVEADAVLFTQQEADTYPALMLQFALNVRPDVRVLNLQWLEEKSYRAMVVKREGWSWATPEETIDAFMRQFLTEKNILPPVYFGIMTKPVNWGAEAEKLFLTGLAFQYSHQAFDNVAVLSHNIEQNFRLDDLRMSMAIESEPAAVAEANLRYVPALLLLHRQCLATAEFYQAAQYLELATHLAQAGGKSDELMPLFDAPLRVKPVISAISVKNLEKGMKKVSAQLYAANTETTNGQYELFLSDLLKNKEFDQMSVCRTGTTDWIALLPKELSNLPYEKIFEHGHPDGPEFPVQNISHEAAELYCAWITRVYNASSEKKKFKQVRFRLPTEQEWILAASGGVSSASYPWHGHSAQNAKGCYLGNFSVAEPCTDCPIQKKSISNDGGLFPVRANAYFPNKLGLYAVSGNVAEMISVPGKAKGGSWQDTPQDAQIGEIKNYTLPSPAVGFRVFMEVIAE